MIGKRPVGVIGSGSFGTTLTLLLSYNRRVILYARRQEVADAINHSHTYKSIKFPVHVEATTDKGYITGECPVIFPVVPSKSFSNMIRDFNLFLNPGHILIHGTKGLDAANLDEGNLKNLSITRSDIRTMSEVILEESTVRRVGCLSGPNLAAEIIAGQPAASVIASPYDEVIEIGTEVLSSERFYIFQSHDMTGAELAGAFKNIFALGNGMLVGMNLGRNLQALLLTRGLQEMVYLGKAMGATALPFLGTAGIGDLIATATSDKSRNFSVGYKMAKGMTLEEARSEVSEIAEGLRTLKIAEQLGKYYNVNIPIVNMLYRVVFEGVDIEKAVHLLMRYPYVADVDII